jgi:cytochrome c peroxidase
MTFFQFSAIAQPPQGQQELPAVNAPDENPITEEKRILGKILFWDEQLSSDNTVSCGSCHLPAAGGSDPRLGVNPGPDHIFGNEDDIIGAIGIALYDENLNPVAHRDFGYSPQVTGRSAPSFLTAMFADELFWDGRAGESLIDPLTGEVAIEEGAALETQALGPILSDVEMAKIGRTWEEVTDKLELVGPLALADNLTPDIENTLNEADSYPELFALAFGDQSITPVRIAMAIATYERTLIPNQSPFDDFVDGNNGALTADQREGLDLFRNSVCNRCHEGSLFTDQDFETIGLRPPEEDTGREAVTNDNRDTGAFRVPSLRNVGLRNALMHNGRITDVQDAINFYNSGTSDTGHEIFRENLSEVRGQDGRPDIRIDEIDFLVDDPEGQQQVVDFLSNGLTDPRVANEQFPFDRPTLSQENDDLHESASTIRRAFTNDSVQNSELVLPEFQVSFQSGEIASSARTFDSGNTLEITAQLEIVNEDVGSDADIYVILRMNKEFYMKTSEGELVPWDARLSTMEPFVSRDSLSNRETIPVASGDLDEGNYSLYLGYATVEGIVFNPSAITFGIE